MSDELPPPKTIPKVPTVPSASRWFRRWPRLVTFVVVTTLTYIAFKLRMFFSQAKNRRRVTQGWTKFWCLWLIWLCGIRLTIKGERPPAGSLLTPNHIGYCDIMAMKAAIETYTITRTEMMSWPLLGAVMKQLGYPHVGRKQSKDLKAVAMVVANTLRDGDRICAFLEGTSTGGDRVLTFKSAIIQGAIDAGAAIVPVAIIWTTPDPDVVLAEDVAYWKDHEIGPHVMRFLGLRALSVEITFGKPIPTQGRERKDLAAEAHREVVRMTGLPELPRADVQ